jgi:uncharacterized protein (TIGR03067 family)
MLTVAVAFFAAPVSQAADDAAKILKDMEGNYELKALTLGGEKAPEQLTKDLKGISIKDGVIKIEMASRSDDAKIKLDPSKKPGHIDLTPVKDDAGKVRLGLYLFEKGELTIVFAREGDRPANLDGKGEKEMKMVLTKKK